MAIVGVDWATAMYINTSVIVSTNNIKEFYRSVLCFFLEKKKVFSCIFSGYCDLFLILGTFIFFPVNFDLIFISLCVFVKKVEVMIPMSF